MIIPAFAARSLPRFARASCRAGPRLASGRNITRFAGAKRGSDWAAFHNGRSAHAYSTTSPLQDDILDIVKSEIDVEVSSGNMEMPEELSDLKRQLTVNWKIVDDEDSATIQLYLNDKKVQLSFHCQDTVPDPLEEEEDDMEAEDGEEDEPASDVRFTVTQTKAGKTLVFNCITAEEGVQIEGVATSKQDVDAIHAQQGTLEKSSYEGPEFLDLDERLQSSFYEYLEKELKVSSDVTDFIAMYTDYKEQQLYTQFLKDVEAMVS
eukprot:CAMPEP_0198111564 /NCGR_PEP_ID=MMETSP1442-20131203/3528_1 /TAXON_ID= /ORGANISM="Craspedostauros australis, Strain CCMP3328" /LENGTH=263 /DNA_ID=CAMNT_0043768061 /DNA_START=186 /DNA_END=977 /DNA_ORIENTATION=-